MFLRRIIRSVALASLLLVQGATAHAAWMWDQNQDKIDDRILAVETQGLTAAHVGNTLAGKLRFAVMNAAAPFAYGVYVGYDHHPTDADATALAALGVPVQVRYRSIDYIRSVVTYAQAQQIAALAGVSRIETIPIFYQVNDVAARTLRARDSGNQLFPSVWKNLGVTGKGIVVAILDTGVNDAPDGSYPGHESLRGKFVGGGSFWSGQPELNTPLDQSINPTHAVDPEVTYHGTHVAGTAIGSGGPQGMLNGAAAGFNAGLAPDARLVDCKVLSDAGTGLGSADALDWLIYNRFNTWASPAPIASIAVSRSRTSRSAARCVRRHDANCAAVNAAHKAGIVVCVLPATTATPPTCRRRRRPTGAHRRRVHRRQHHQSARRLRRRLQQRGPAHHRRRQRSSSTR
jgi:subtilisin family serine protease